MFRTTKQDDLSPTNVFVFFELVCYIKHEENKNQNKMKKTDEYEELCCAWTKIPLAKLNMTQNSFKLELKGGGPNTTIEIEKEDIHDKRTGILNAFRAQGKTVPQLTISLKQFQKLEADVQSHLTLMPSTCLLQKKMLHFISGFRNYAASQLLDQA